MDDDFFMVAAIDFGTTYSGCAYSSIADNKKDPPAIYLLKWRGGGMETGKCPTTVLFSPDGEFHSFGYEAEDKYTELIEDEPNDVHKKWYYFRRFKMHLYDRQDTLNSLEIQDETRKKMPASKVFSAAIKFFVKSFFEIYEKQVDDPRMSDIKWVLTVPAIWDDSAKDFMRRCATEILNQNIALFRNIVIILGTRGHLGVPLLPGHRPNTRFSNGSRETRDIFYIHAHKGCEVTLLSSCTGPLNQAGIIQDKLVLCLEPEAASIHCKQLSLSRQDCASKVGAFMPGKRYIVIDAGGGTVDISAHEVQEDFTIKEIIRSSGGPWGGICVDAEFIILLNRIFGEEVIQTFELQEKEGMLTLLRDFEIKKKMIREDDDTKIRIILPLFLQKQKLSENIQENNSPFSKVGDKLKIPNEYIVNLFCVTTKTTDHLNELFAKQECHDISHILLAGGFSDSLIFQKRIEATFPDKTILIPPDAVLSVLKGAVMFGHNPRIITTRKCKYTYGVRTCSAFDEEVHPASAKTLVDDSGIKQCCGLFDIFVKIDQEISINEHHAECYYSVVRKNQTEMNLFIYTSKLPNPMFVTDRGCKNIGELIVDMPDTTKGMDRGATLKMKFSGTEIEVEAIVKDTGERAKTTLEFWG